MKKLLSLILAAMLCFVGIQPIYAAAPDNNDKMSQAINLLKSIDILDSATEGMINDNMSRAQFAVLTARIIGVNEYSSNAIRYFNDVPMNHWALNSINTLVEKGVLVQADDKMFRPDETISALDAGVILLKLAGYEKYAEYKGGYPNGYSTLISDTKIANGVSSSAKMTVADACMMIYNALQIGTYQITEFKGDNSFVGNIDEDVTLLSRYFDIYHEKDVVNGTQTVSLNGVNAAKGQVVVGTTKYNVKPGLDLYSYLGMTVDIFYRQEKKDDNATIIAVNCLDSYNNVVEINLKNIDSVSEDYRIDYHEPDNDKGKNVKIPKTAQVVKNRCIYEGGLISELENKNGTVKLISSKNASGYNVVIIESYKNFVVSYLDKDDEQIYLKGLNIPIKLQDYEDENVKILACDDSEVSIDTIKKDDLLSIYSADNNIRIYKNTQILQGKVSSIDWNEKTIIVDGEEYDMDYDFAFENSKKIFSGDIYMFGIDLFGQIASIKNGSTDGFMYGYLISVARDNESAEDRLILKIYNEQDELLKLNCYDRLTIDSSKTKDLDAAYAILPEKQLIRYSTKADGSLKEVDTQNFDKKKESKYSLHETIAEQKLVYNSAGAFSSQIASYPTAMMSDNTICFSIPEDVDGAAKKDFAILDRSNFSVWDNKEVVAYKVDETSPYEDVVVVKGGKSAVITTKTAVIMVDSIKEELNSDDEIVEVLNAYRNGNKISYTMADNYSLEDKGITCGDIIQIGRDNQGFVNDMNLIFDCSEMKASNSPLYKEDYLSEHRVTSGKVISKSGNVIRIGHTSVSSIDEIADISNTTIIVCEPKNKKEKIYRGTIDDVLDYENTQSNASIVVGYTYIGRMDQLFIYR